MTLGGTRSLRARRAASSGGDAARRVLFAAAAASIIALTACTASTGQSTQPSPSSTDAGPTASPSGGAVGEQVEVAPGRYLWLDCQGEGSPTVILESGIHDSSEYWVNVQLLPPAAGPDVFTAVAEHTRVCRYDRPGTIIPGADLALTDRSTPVEGPRTIEGVATDLEAALDAAGIEPPYLLAGHSFGGFLQTYYAQTHPDDVAGLVLIDAFSDRMQEFFGDKWAAYEPVLNGGPLQDETGWETFDVSASVMQSAAAEPLRSDLPMVVLSKTEPFPLPADVQGFTSADLESVWAQVQADLATRVPGTPHMIAQGSDHYIQVREPDLVTSAILLVLHRIAGEQ